MEIDAGTSPRVYFHDVGVDPNDPEALYAATPWGVYQLSPGSPTVVEQGDAGLPAACELGQNYPNPFNAGTVIRFSIPAATKATVTIHNLLGQTVRKLVDERIEAGVHSARWDGRNDAGQRMSSGVYVYRLQTAQSTMTRKLVLVK